MTKTLLVHSSGRTEGSVTRMLAEELASVVGGDITVRDVTQGIPFVSSGFAQKRGSGEQIPELALSDALVAELQAADTLILGVPVYNFSVPAALKAWIDQIAVAGKTFSYSEAGPKGLLEGKKAYLVVASGGMPVDSDWDYATPYLRHVLGFIGITDVTVIAADALGNGAEKTLEEARAKIAAQASARAA